MSLKSTSAKIHEHIRELLPVIRDLSQKDAIRLIEEYCAEHKLNVILIKRILDIKWKHLKPVKQNSKSMGCPPTDHSAKQKKGYFIQELFTNENERTYFLEILRKNKELHHEYKQLKTKQEKYDWIKANKELVRAKNKENIKRKPRIQEFFDSKKQLATFYYNLRNCDDLLLEYNKRLTKDEKIKWIQENKNIVFSIPDGRSRNHLFVLFLY
jgi:Fe2+ transport system protein B